jgi:hypothetical protein
VTFTGTLTTLNLQAGAGDDMVSVTPGPLAIATINVDGGDPTASDTLIVNGTLNIADAVTIGTLTSDGAVVTGLGATINVTTVEHLHLMAAKGATA